MAALVSVGVVTWNSAGDLPGCLEAIARQTHPHLQVIVVDNGSRDASLEIVAARCPQALVLRNPGNAGFCRAHNQAIRAAKGDFYLPLNPDVVMEPDYVATLVSALERLPGYGSAGGKLLQSGPEPDSGPARFDSTGLFIDRRRRQYLRGHGEPDRGQYQNEEEVFGVDGAAPLYRRTMLDDVSFEGEYFDESFFSHKEDVDLAWRARLLGWRCRYVPAAVAHHRRTFRPGASKRRRIDPAIKVHGVKNRYLLLLKNDSWRGLRRDALPVVVYDLATFGYLLARERTSLAALKMLRDLWPRTLAWRRAIWARVREPDALSDWLRTGARR
jgi:GT2 family glycosyltransferase